MKYSKLNSYFFVHSIGLILLSVIFFMSAGDALAQKKVKKKKKAKPFELKVGLSSTYDDNILKYSDKYLERFMNGEDEGRFHIKTYDDLIVNPSLELEYTFRIFKKHKSELSASYSPKLYTVNSIKNWDIRSIEFRQYFAKRANFKISYSYIPYFYVRHFRDDNWINVYGYTSEAFQPYSFSKDNYGGWVENTFFKNTKIRFTFYYSTYYHNQHYTEYDSKNFLYGIKFYQPLHRKFKVELAYQFITSDAKGYDASISTPETTLGPDATYVEDIFNLSVIYYLPKLKKRSNHLDISFAYMKRFYSSQYSALVDPLHAGRVDNNYRLYFTYKISLSSSFKLYAYYNWLMRDSHTKAKINSSYVSDEKDYNQNQVGLKVMYNFKF